jgi:polyketide biosynthesis enoyl-CoA hydratase PksH
MTEALNTALDEIEDRPAVAVLVITATGECFCRGGEVGRPGTPGWPPDLSATQRLLFRFARSPLVTIAMVEGPATGGGVGLACACDLVIAGPRASFRLTEILLGLLPAAVSPLLAARVGVQQARRLGLTAQTVTAEQALALGLADVHTTCPAREIRHVLRDLSRADPAALRALKRFYYDLWPVSDTCQQLAVDAVRARLADPLVAQRIVRLHTAGLLP